MEELGCLDLEFSVVTQLPGLHPWLFLGYLELELSCLDLHNISWT